MIPRYLYPYTSDKMIVEKTDCLVVGSGIAGLFTAIEASRYMDVTLITKESIESSNTRWAQGGVAAVMSPEDSPELHKADTLMAGAGLCNEQMVHILACESPRAIKKLIQYGVSFDQHEGHLALTREGAHSKRRILHAHGDATGAEIVRGLIETVKSNPNITISEHTMVHDLLVYNEQCLGAIVQRADGQLIKMAASAVILATGGVGQLYTYTTNPSIATGDGIAIAFRAGAEIQDMEFIQFHPTVFVPEGRPPFLISEALRGEGAILRNGKGEAFMANVHTLADLAPRDIVSRAIHNEIMNSDDGHVYLDITQREESWLKQRFPTIYQTCQSYGYHLSSDWIPVTPAAHYIMGGVRTNHNGATAIRGLYACGETACTGVHGANRLASNSLSEAVVIADRLVQDMLSKRQNGQLLQLSFQMVALQEEKLQEEKLQEEKLQEEEFQENSQAWTSESLSRYTRELQYLMMKDVSLVRQSKSLIHTKERIQQMINQLAKAELPISKQASELYNLLICGYLTTSSAFLRTESRGGHYRSDFDQTDQRWRLHLIYKREANGEIKERREHVSSKMENTSS